MYICSDECGSQYAIHVQATTDRSRPVLGRGLRWRQRVPHHALPIDPKDRFRVSGACPCLCKSGMRLSWSSDCSDRVSAAQPDLLASVGLRVSGSH